jgi:hypothetical protein
MNSARNVNDLYDAAIPANNLAWTVNFNIDGATNTVAGPLTGIANGAFTIPPQAASDNNSFYKIVLVATDSAGRCATNPMSIFPSSIKPSAE